MAGVLVLLLGGGASPVVAANNVKLAWDASPSPTVVGYRIYYGGTSRTYTNSVTVGNVTTDTLSNLKSGGTYYIATTARDASGLESAYSNEATYTVPAGGADVQIRPAANGQVLLTVAGNSGSTYEIQVSTNLTSWTVLNTVTIGATGSTTLTDSAAPNRARRFYRTRSL